MSSDGVDPYSLAWWPERTYEELLAEAGLRISAHPRGFGVVPLGAADEPWSCPLDGEALREVSGSTAGVPLGGMRMRYVHVDDTVHDEHGAALEVEALGALKRLRVLDVQHHGDGSTSYVMTADQSSEP